MLEYNIYIGLLKSDMKTPLNKSSVLEVINHQFGKIGIDGFNAFDGFGYWKGKQEPCLKISFLNTFGVDVSDLEHTLNILKGVLEQESILYTCRSTREVFI